MSEPVILVTGATGLLGPYLVDRTRAIGRTFGLARTGSDIDCDLTDARATSAVITELAPDLVVHAAAQSDVDECEHHPDAADQINRGATKNIADALSDEAFLVFFSSIAVYPDTAGPHREGSEDPVNVYGRTKLAGERAAQAHPHTLILRTSMFGPSRNPTRMSLSDFILAKLRKHEPLPLFADELFSPLHVETLSDLTMRLAQARITGVFNANARDGMSKAEFGQAIASKHNLPTDMISVVDSRQMPGRTRRALDMRLDPKRLENTIGETMPSLKEEIARL